MSKQWYGSVANRIEEGRIYGEDKTIREEMDITMYLWSDRSCYYVTKVVDQKHIFVKSYHVCADHSKKGGMGHQDWLYFKSIKEQHKYLNSIFPGEKYNENVEENDAEEWVFRYNSWKRVSRWTLDSVKAHMAKHFIGPRFTEKEMDAMEAGKEVVKYHDLTGKVSFGIKDYYHDWEL